MDKNVIDGRDWDFPEGDDFVDSHLMEKEITENGEYNGPDEGNGVRGYSKVIVSGGGPSLSIISKQDWDAMTSEEKRSYSLIVIETSESGFVRGQYVDASKFTDILIVHQLYGMENGNFAYECIADNIVDFEFTDGNSQAGVILEVLKSKNTNASISFQILSETNTVQYGSCLKDASLPLVITMGSGRLQYSTNSALTINNLNPKDVNLFMGLYNPGGSYKIRVTVTEDS